MRKTTLIITLFVICFSTSCKKDKVKDECAGEVCWKIFVGDYLNTGRRNNGGFCNMTEEEFLNCTTCGYNGRVRDFVSSCDYSDAGICGPKTFYWEVKLVGATTYTGAYLATEKEASCYLGANGTLYRKK
jgi:hypothetical protein